MPDGDSGGAVVATWKLKDGRVLELIREDEFDALPNGTELVSIRGESVVLGRDKIDNDTRGGYLAYGRVRGEEAT